MDSALKDILKEERRRREGREGREGRESRKEGRDGEKRREDKRESRKEQRDDKRRDDKRERNKHKIDKPRNDKIRDDKRDNKFNGQKNRSLKNEESISIEYVTANTNQEIKFMFVYEDKEGILFTKLDSIPKEEGNTAKIFPVYLHGHNANLIEEEITFKDGKWISSNIPEDPDATWLNIVEDEILPFELSDVVVSNNLFFHCEDDLIDYIKEFGSEYLPVKNE